MECVHTIRDLKLLERLVVDAKDMCRVLQSWSLYEDQE